MEKEKESIGFSNICSGPGDVRVKFIIFLIIAVISCVLCLTFNQNPSKGVSIAVVLFLLIEFVLGANIQRTLTKQKVNAAISGGEDSLTITNLGLKVQNVNGYFDEAFTFVHPESSITKIVFDSRSHIITIKGKAKRTTTWVKANGKRHPKFGKANYVKLRVNSITEVSLLKFIRAYTDKPIIIK